MTRPKQNNLGKSLPKYKIATMKSLYTEGHTMSAIARTCDVSVDTVRKYRDRDGWAKNRERRVAAQRDRLIMGEMESSVTRVQRIDAILGKMEQAITRRQRIEFSPTEYERLLRIRATLLAAERKRTPFDSYEELCRAFDMLKPGDVERLKAGKRLRDRDTVAMEGNGSDDDSAGALAAWEAEVDDDDGLLMDDEIDEDIDDQDESEDESEEGGDAKHPAGPHPRGLGPPGL